MLDGKSLTVLAIVRTFLRSISLTWLFSLCEMVLTALLPLFVGFAIDGLLSGDIEELFRLAVLMAFLISIAVTRRIYDTRVFGTVRVELGKSQMARGAGIPVSSLNARLNMARELVGFLEEDLPMVMMSVVQLIVAVVVLYFFHQSLALAGLVAFGLVICVYAAFHRLFFRLNGRLNNQIEQQVRILERRRMPGLAQHLLRLRKVEVQISDTESILYGSVYVVLLGLILFNLWFATTSLEISAGTIFSIVMYSWEFVEASLAIPAVLQSWSRLSEITQRINNES
ncbi:MAG: ABC transporter six-transmembrane domain-containing protein [Parvibaculaceae bacterium]|nr:ABC transporter six-transmembrane domain-containing protein [Parvibaculaceae bacterium]HBM87173.1 hypothetical protein [Rhodobiaceae bacterium]|tara:strand:- start:2151 stop:3002 length:852 start_codon:yes stop_codon:yes gene_type:complete